MSEHADPHLVSNLCDCDCDRCTMETGEDLTCICPECNPDQCGLHLWWPVD